jgi:hypothetical protein
VCGKFLFSTRRLSTRLLAMPADYRGCGWRILCTPIFSKNIGQKAETSPPAHLGLSSSSVRSRDKGQETKVKRQRSRDKGQETKVKRQRLLGGANVLLPLVQRCLCLRKECLLFDHHRKHVVMISDVWVSPPLGFECRTNAR